MKFKRIGASVALTTVVALGLAACAANENSDSGESGTSNLSGTLAGQGATSMEAAQVQWSTDFQQSNSKVTVNYAGEGSSAGRKAFAAGGVDFAGTDSAMKVADMSPGSLGKCTDKSAAMNLPIYVSPIAIIYNLKEVPDLKLDGPTTAAIFKGDIKTWDDAKIKALNPGAKLPSAPITTVHRNDGSGTTENLTDWLKQTSDGVWDAKVSSDWPYKGGEAAKGTSGVVGIVEKTPNTIGYADESQAKKLQVAAIKDGDAFNKPSAEAAAKVLEASPKADGRGEHDWALKIDRKAAGYSLILVSYAVVCEDYKDDNTAALVKSYLGYIASEKGQESGQKASGLAPLPGKLRDNVKAAIDSIK